MTESSFLTIILLLWSVPVLIYVILFLPELNQLLLGRVHPSRNNKSDNGGIETPFEYLLPMVAAAAIALIVGFLVDVSWPVCLMLMGAAAALIGGMAFTFFQMHTLGHAQKPSAPKLSRGISGGVEAGDPAASTLFLEESNVPERWRIIRRFLARNQRTLYKRD